MEKSKKIKTIIAVVAISFLQGLQHSVTPMLQSIQDAFPDVKTSLVQMLVSGPGLLAMAVALLSGILVTKISKKKLLLFAAALALITGFLPFVKESFALLFACRIVYGITLGLCMSLNGVVVADFFEGQERVQVMGIQAAAVGAGMMIINAGAGTLGASDYHLSYWINLIALIAFILLLLCLPDTGRVVTDRENRISLNKEVFIMGGIGFFFFLFLITFNTNISMHIGGKYAGNSSFAGIVNAVFSLIQIAAGFVLGMVTKLFRRQTMTAALVSFAIGAMILVLFPANAAMLLLGALFCGICQGIFMPTGMVTVTNAVNPQSAAMATAVFSCGIQLGGFVSPIVTNFASDVIFGEEGTGHVFLIASVGMLILAVLTGIWRAADGKKETES